VTDFLRSKQLRLSLDALRSLVEAEQLFNESFHARCDIPSLLGFMLDRLAGSLREGGYSAQEVDAVLALAPARLGDVPRRLEAVRAFASLPEAAALASANKRVSNILKKVEGERPTALEPTLFVEPAERELAAALGVLRPQADAKFDARDYAGSLQTLAALRAPVDAFFEGVMVNADDPALRRNRLALLGLLHAAMNRVADLSRLAS
jgi:glycyl-tRNA synthetase beta chain